MLEAFRKQKVSASQTTSYGRFVQTGEGDFFRPEDASHQANYLDALDSLLTKGLVRSEEGEAYRLTGRGFEVRKELKTVAAGSAKT